MSKPSTIVKYFDECDNILLEFKKDFTVIPKVGERVHIDTIMYVVRSIDHHFINDMNNTHSVCIYMQDYFNSIMV